MDASTDLEGLEAADGPRVRLALPDGQELLAVVRRRRREPGPAGGWWYLLEVQLWAVTQLADGRMTADPAPVECWAPARVCTPLEGQDYDEVVTEAPHRTVPLWLLEERDDVLVVHRGDCAAPEEGISVIRPALAETVRHAAAAGATPCPVCRPPAP